MSLRIDVVAECFCEWMGTAIGAVGARIVTKHSDSSSADTTPVDANAVSAEAPAPDLLWKQAVSGSAQARDQLLALCYAELRSLARRMLAGDSSSYRLQPTELVNEAVLRVLKLDRMQWNDRAHFLSTAATVMRQTLLDEVRRFHASKRQRPAVMTTWFDAGISTMDLDLERLDHSLNRLTAISPERAKLVELRFFVGLTIEETADVLGISPATVKRQWDAARGWLLRDLQKA